MKKVQDFYFQQAKREKYPARSVYKLKEINEKYKIIKKNFTVLDIGCSPGSWSQYILENIGKGKVVGIDIRDNVHIDDPRFRFLKGDLLEINKSQFIDKTNKFDLITSDAAPNTTGDKFSDSQKSLAIVERVFEIAKDTLKPHGSIVAKIFQGEDLKGFIQRVKKEYARILLFKPQSSRQESRELFIIALDRRVSIDTEH